MEFGKGKALVQLRHAVFGHIHMDDMAGLVHQLPHQLVRDTVIQVADVACRVLVPLNLTRHGRGERRFAR